MSDILIDYRETELIKFLQFRNIPHTVESLLVGDIWIGVNREKKEQPDPLDEKDQKESEEQKPKEHNGWIIERKTIKDFEASFLDGRYREQRGRILSYCQESGAQPMYVLEESWSSLSGRIAKKALMKLLNRLQLRYDIPVTHTRSAEETVEWIESLWEQWKEDPSALKRTKELVKVSDGIHIQKKANAADPKTFLLTCLANCPGVSVKMAESLVTLYPTLTRIMEQ